MDEATDGIVWLKEIQKANITCEEFQMQSSVPYNEVLFMAIWDSQFSHCACFHSLFYDVLKVCPMCYNPLQMQFEPHFKTFTMTSSNN